MPVRTAVGTILFHVLSLLAFLPFLLLFPLLFLPRVHMQRAARAYLRLHSMILRVTCGISWSVSGRQHLPTAPFVVASQHESSWETLYFHEVFPDAVMYAKRQVFGYPALGRVARKIGHIPVNRTGSVDAMRKGLEDGLQVLAAGRSVLLFPTGTRGLPGEHPLQPGAGVLYHKSGLPVVPVRLDSGRCWPAGRLAKNPGHITVEILPPIPTGLGRAAFMAELEEALGQRPTPK